MGVVVPQVSVLGSLFGVQGYALDDVRGPVQSISDSFSTQPPVPISSQQTSDFC